MLFENDSDRSYGSIAIRQTGGSQKLEESAGYTFRIGADGVWKLYRKGAEIVSGTVSDDTVFKKGTNVWNNLKLQGAGATIRAYVNNHLITEYTDQNPVTSGRIGLGCSYTHTEFDNLKVMKIKGFVPYYTELLDNMETYDLSKDKKEKLIYQGKWNHANGKGMYVYQRSLSETKEVGSSLTYSFTGTGIEVLSGTDQAGKVSITVDGTVVAAQQELQKADNMNMTCAVTGLEYQKHTVTFTLKEGTFSVDMVGVLGKTCDIADENTVSGNWKDTTNEDPAVWPTETPVPAGDEEVLIPEIISGPEPTVPPLPDWTQTPVTEAPQQTSQAPQESSKPGEVTAEPQSTPSATETPAGNVPTERKPSSDQKVTLIKDANAVYRIVNAKKKTAAFVRLRKQSAKTAVIPAAVKGYCNGKKISCQVVAVDQKAFDGCKNLKRIRIQSKQLQKIGKNAFRGIHRKAVFTLPSSCKKQYRKLFTAKTGYQKKTMKLKF